MRNFNSGGFGSIPPVVKNLLIINVLLLLATFGLGTAFRVNLIEELGLYFPASSNFHPYQIVTHMFMHGGWFHLFFNMFALWMFGRVLESVWGPKRFFLYYIVTGLGAAGLHLLVNYINYRSLISGLSQEEVRIIVEQGRQMTRFPNVEMRDLAVLLNTPTVGASGAVFGVLLGFGMLFPNTRLMLLFPPIPIKAKYLVIGYGALELYLGLTQPGSNIAHFAHLGGMVFGFFLIKYWNKKGDSFY